jgi:WD40 repeat protein
VHLWNVTTGMCDKTFEGDSNWVNSVAVTKDVTKFVSGSDDKTVRLWDICMGMCEKTMEGHSETVALKIKQCDYWIWPLAYVKRHSKDILNLSQV